jgi:hypothetical protein
MMSTKMTSPIRFMLTCAVYAFAVASHTRLGAVELLGPPSAPPGINNLDVSSTFYGIAFLEEANGVTFHDVFEPQQPVSAPLTFNSATSALAAVTAVDGVLNGILPLVSTAIDPKAESWPNLNISFPFTPPPVDVVGCQINYDSGSISWQRMPPLGGLTLSRNHAGTDNYVLTQAAAAGSTLPVLGAMVLVPIGSVSLARFRKRKLSSQMRQFPF